MVTKRYHRVLFALIALAIAITLTGCGEETDRSSSITTATLGSTDAAVEAAEEAAKEVLEDLGRIRERTTMLHEGLYEAARWSGTSPEFEEKAKGLATDALAISGVLNSTATAAGVAQVMSEGEALPSLCNLKNLLEDVKRKAGEVDTGIDELDTMLQPLAAAEKLEGGNQWEIKIFSLHGSQGILVPQAEGALLEINEALRGFSEGCDSLPPPPPSPTPLPPPTPTERPRDACRFTGTNPDDAWGEVFWWAGDPLPVRLADILPVAGNCVLYTNGGGSRGWIPNDKNAFFDGFHQIQDADSREVVMTFKVEGTVGP